jgi:hypothetical protein
LGALFGSIYHWYKVISKSPNTRNILLAVIVSVCSVVIVYTAAAHSNQMFAYWKMKAISGAEWQQMALDVSRLARQVDNTYDNRLSPKDWPKSFDHLGSAEDFHHAEYVKWDTGEVAVRVTYGGRYRAWGLLVAPDDYLNIGPWSKFKRTGVATNAYFYVGYED